MAARYPDPPWVTDAVRRMAGARGDEDGETVDIIDV